MSATPPALSVLSLVPPRRVVVVPPAELPSRVAAWIATRLRRAIALRGIASLALSGGSTPRGIYRVLAGEHAAGAADWARVEVYFGDERAVPPDDHESNYGMAQATLLHALPVPPKRIHRMEAERADRERAADDYARLLPPRLDVLLLGMGVDGHTASLFPGSPALAERTRRVVAVVAPQPPVARLSITPPVIAAARHVAVIIAGAEKAATAARALEGALSPRELPVQLARRGVWFLDRPAADRLARKA